MPVVDGFPRPKWSVIAELVHAKPEETWKAGWEEWSRRWLDGILHQLPDSYRIKESDNFLILSAQENRYAQLLAQFLERALRRILTGLDGITSDEDYGSSLGGVIHQFFDDGDWSPKPDSWFQTDRIL